MSGEFAASVAEQDPAVASLGKRIMTVDLLAAVPTESAASEWVPFGG